MATKKPATSKAQPKTAAPRAPKEPKNLEVDTDTTTTVKSNKKSKKVKKPRTTKQKMVLAALIFVAVLLVAGTIATIVLLLTHKDEIEKAGRAEYTEPVYSLLTGEEIANESLKNAPT